MRYQQNGHAYVVDDEKVSTGAADADEAEHADENNEGA